MRTIDRARGKWHGILRELGIPASFLVDRHGPCPLCGGVDRFRFDDKRGDGTYYCSGCGPGLGIHLAMGWTGLGFQDCANRIDSMCGGIQVTKQAEDDEERKRRAIKRMKAVSAYLHTLTGSDPASMYLKSRGIAQPPKEFVKIHYALEYYDQGYKGKHPAMIAAFRRPCGKVESLHATYLGESGKAPVRSPKKVLGAIEGLSGCAIRLSPIAPHIAIAEGIETALSVTQLYGMPCWATYSANGMESFEPPEGVEEITIYGDADDNYVGQSAAMNCAKRLVRSGYRVNVPEFLPIGMDYNDRLMEGMR